MSALQIVELMNAEDATVAEAIALEKQNIARAMEMIAGSLRHDGRLVYIGAGTSGRLGVLDASECPPTFNTPPRMVVGIIAGGFEALTRPVEGAEDSPQQAIEDLRKIDFSSNDTLVGIATSGRTPYVLGGLDYAREMGATAIGFTCNGESQLHTHADLVIAPVVGPEVVSGSTRLKAGTATKMVLNMLTTGAMVLLGKTYGNLMVDLQASNTKLKERSVRIVSEVTGMTPEDSKASLLASEGDVKTAIVSYLAGVDATTARGMLRACQGRLREAIHAHAAKSSVAEDQP